MIRHAPTGLVVESDCEDGRHVALRIEQLPLVGWREPMAAALSHRVGPTGSLRTRASVKSMWGVVLRFTRFLDGMAHPPQEPAGLTTTHLESFRKFRASTIGEQRAWAELRQVGILLETEATRSVLAADVRDYLTRRTDYRGVPKPGYSDDELHRLISAARSDVVALRDRLNARTEVAAGDRSGHSGAFPPADQQQAAVLAEIVATGVVPSVSRPITQQLCQRLALAEQVFLTVKDLMPLVVLMIAVTGLNSETIKELPAEHRVLEDRAVEVRILKRRRGPQRWWNTVTWEIGAPGRELHTPGGLYLLIRRLTARSRQASGSKSIWSVWRNGHRAHVTGLHEHFDPFAKDLAYGLYGNDWAARHGLTTSQTEQDEKGPFPLSVDFNRIRTSIEVRRTRQMGGHLPSAARSNTMQVLFGSYLRNDPTTIDWAHTVIDEALLDAEQSALAAHERALAEAGGQLHVHAGPTDAEDLELSGLTADAARHAATGGLDTAWSACTDHDNHPATGKPCRASFLDCFHCGNCLVTRDHLPRLLALLDAFNSRRLSLSEQDWWSQYGPAWAAIRHDILSKFSPAELQAAAQNKPTDALLDLVEPSWERR